MPRANGYVKKSPRFEKEIQVGEFSNHFSPEALERDTVLNYTAVQFDDESLIKDLYKKALQSIQRSYVLVDPVRKLAEKFGAEENHERVLLKMMESPEQPVNVIKRLAHICGIKLYDYLESGLESGIARFVDIPEDDPKLETEVYKPSRMVYTDSILRVAKIVDAEDYDFERMKLDPNFDSRPEVLEALDQINSEA